MNAIKVLTPRIAAGLVREVPPRANKFAQYFKSEIAPPTVDDWPVIKKEAEKLLQSYRDQKWRNVTQALLSGLVGVEVAMWFFAGEVIGRWNFYGYVIPWTVKHPTD